MDDIKAAVGSGDFQRCYELLRDSTASAADLGPCIDFALGLADSTAVHLLLAFGASLDIRQAYSAVDRFLNPQPFRLMETYRLPPLTHFILTRPRDIAGLRSYIGCRPELSQTSIVDSFRGALGALHTDLHRGDHHPANGDQPQVIADLVAFGSLYKNDWAPEPETHALFPAAYRAAVEACVLWRRGPPEVPLAIWRRIFSCLDRSALSRA
mmetsp:Transcript_80553/g.260980  ORF Transcript_80553/g.260980 Transcript_80553/m.260980 type:complete len:211 (+) Transcript_80553:38-670(+)